MSGDGMSSQEYFESKMGFSNPEETEQEEDPYGEAPELLEEDYTGWVGDEEEALKVLTYLIEVEGVEHLTELEESHSDFVSAVESYHGGLENVSEEYYQELAEKGMEQTREYNIKISEGGTKISSAYELAKDIVEEEYPWSDWNRYILEAGDGDNWGGGEKDRKVKEQAELQHARAKADFHDEKTE